MLFSLSNRYVFLANPKAASTTIQTSYANRVELASCQGIRFGRHPTFRHSGNHTNYNEFRKIYDPFFAQFLPVDHFFVFGVVREPFDRLRSRYRFHARPEMELRNPGLYTGNMTFDDFVRKVVSNPKYASDLTSQRDFFAGDDGEIGANYLIRMENMESSIAQIREVTGLDFSDALHEVRNKSPERDSGLEDRGLAREARDFLAGDYALYETQTDRLLKPVAPGGELDVDDALRWLVRRIIRYDLGSSIIFKLAQRLERDPDFKVTDLLNLVDGNGSDD